jgi:hypothetical protein
MRRTGYHSRVNESPQELTPATARRVAAMQLAFFALLLAGFAVSGTYTQIADHARDGIPLEFWRPFTWETTSCLVLWFLVLPMAWWVRRFPLSRASWMRDLPVHLMSTVPFSLLHVAGMVGLRKLVYRLMGDSYDFGAWWPNWQYEYRKDFLAYWITVGGLAAFHIYGLWLDSRRAASDVGDAPPAGVPLERLVVRKLNREFIVNLADVDRIEADGNYVSLYVQGSVYPLRESLAALEKRLDGRRFARVHRGHIVNIDRIREIQPWDHGDYRILLKDGSFVNFSRRYRSRLSHLFH